MKFKIKKNEAFYLYNKSNWNLFQIGFADIYIHKQNRKSFVYQNDRSSFDYQGIENALIGKTGYNSLFEPKRILVIQMK